MRKAGVAFASRMRKEDFICVKRKGEKCRIACEMRKYLPTALPNAISAVRNIKMETNEGY